MGTGKSAIYLQNLVNNYTGFLLSIDPDTPSASHGSLILEFDKDIENEGYRLDISTGGIRLSASDDTGLFYGCQTLRQILVLNSLQTADDSIWLMPNLTINDSPEFAWRGMMLDVSRHFFPKDFIFSLLDYLAYHKLNVFHWHLVDDQGWRIEIKQYPKLTETAAWRVDREGQLWGLRTAQLPDEQATYGGYYTQEDIREIVNYARERHITIVPEIEMPAHVTCALAAYPELSCTGGPFTVPPGSIWPIKDIYCAGKESTFEFLENILAEVIELFPGEYIHIGGDEAHKGEWEKCDSCQRRIAEEGLADEAELQSYFIKRIEKYLKQHGRKLIGWDEIIEGGLAPAATVMSWRGLKGGIAAAQAGHKAVMSPVSHCYVNCYQGQPELEPKAQSSYLPLKKAYSFNPLPAELSASEAQLIIGGQANLWTEFVPSPQHAEYMLFPRLSALAEVFWTPADKRRWGDFRYRIADFARFYDIHAMHYSTSAQQVTFTISKRWWGGRYLVMSTEAPELEIRYRRDGRKPTAAARLYHKPIKIRYNQQISAGSFDGEDLVSPVSRIEFINHKARGKKVNATSRYHWRYPGGGIDALTNGIRAGSHSRNPHWQGYRQNDFVGTVDLGRKKRIKSVSLGVFQDMGAAIFFPEKIEIALSGDGEFFTPVASISPAPATGNSRIEKRDFSATLAGVRTRYIRITARNIGSCPPWHFGAGRDAYIFLDEIVIK